LAISNKAGGAQPAHLHTLQSS